MPFAIGLLPVCDGIYENSISRMLRKNASSCSELFEIERCMEFRAPQEPVPDEP